MKPKIKTLNKKLTLSKKNIANLNSVEQKKVLGGVAFTWYGVCPATDLPKNCASHYTCWTECGPPSVDLCN